MGFLSELKEAFTNSYNEGKERERERKEEKKWRKGMTKEQKQQEKKEFKENINRIVKFDFNDILEKNNFVPDKLVKPENGFLAPQDTGLLYSKGESGLFVDNTNKRFALAFTNNSERVVHFYNYSDLLNFELNEDGESILQGKILSTVVGGAMFGPVGALTGAAGKRKSKRTCNYMSVRLLLNDLNNSETTIQFIDKEIKKSDKRYKESLQEARELTGVLTYIQNNA